GAAQRDEHAQGLETSAEALRTASQEAEETAARLKVQTEQLEAKIVARAESATQALEETAKRAEETASTQREALLAAAQEIQQQVTAAASSASRWVDTASRSEEHTSELQSPDHLVCRLLLSKKHTTLVTVHQTADRG